MKVVCTGSTFEGQSFTRFLTSNNSTEIDQLFIGGQIKKQNQIVDLPYAPGFIKVHCNNSGLEQFTSCDSNNDIYFDGVKFKQHLYECIASKRQLFNIELDSVSSIETSASVPSTLNFSSTRLKLIFDIFQQNKLNQCSAQPRLRQQCEVYHQLLEKGDDYGQKLYTSALSALSNFLSSSPFGKIFYKQLVPNFDMLPLNKKSGELCCTLMSPAFGIPLSMKNK
ncbi:unnamed protein product [Didymodactylos carnosus]|uniref:Uncharacterized protein n=1 Tax=Didymodactylos carnosus TaxID=1234261 RepID=A0A8S2F549_9BILA|nr:unnamed protein product [Didymodactylos carnosus]CAF4192641.1 unnamed protein product [Didymodactylos carnosus]